MDSDSPTVSYHPNGRLVVSHGGTDDIRAINQHIESNTNLVKTENSSAISPPKVTDMVSVHDIETKSFYLLFMHRLEHRLRRARSDSKVVVFSEPAYAASCTEKLQLATPAYYREKEELKPGIRDRHDGTLTKDGTGWSRRTISAAVAVTRAELSFVSSPEPWVYCAAHYRNDSDLRRLRRHFAKSYGYTVATEIPIPMPSLCGLALISPWHWTRRLTFL